MTQIARDNYTTDEMMTVAASHELRDGVVCFVGIGLPSEAARIVMLGTMRVGVARVSRRSSRR